MPLGIDWDAFQRLPPPADFGGTPVVLSLGRIAAKKGLDVLIRAFAAVASRFEGARLVLAGPDDEDLRPELEALAEREGVDGRVVFPGMLHGPEKLAALAAADVWALPSHTENFGIAVMEALAAGVATVISPAVNLAGEIERAGAGLVAEATPEAFAGAPRVPARGRGAPRQVRGAGARVRARVRLGRDRPAGGRNVRAGRP